MSTHPAPTSPLPEAPADAGARNAQRLQALRATWVAAQTSILSAALADAWDARHAEPFTAYLLRVECPIPCRGPEGPPEENTHG